MCICTYVYAYMYVCKHVSYVLVLTYLEAHVLMCSARERVHVCVCARVCVSERASEWVGGFSGE